MIIITWHSSPARCTICVHIQLHWTRNIQPCQRGVWCPLSTQSYSPINSYKNARKICVVFQLVSNSSLQNGVSCPTFNWFRKNLIVAECHKMPVMEPTLTQLVCQAHLVHLLWFYIDIWLQCILHILLFCWVYNSCHHGQHIFVYFIIVLAHWFCRCYWGWIARVNCQSVWADISRSQSNVPAL